MNSKLDYNKEIIKAKIENGENVEMIANEFLNVLSELAASAKSSYEMVFNDGLMDAESIFEEIMESFDKVAEK